MKCTAMKLTDKRDLYDEPKKSRDAEISMPIFTANESHSYCFPFIKKRHPSPASLKITTLDLPEGQCFNTGSSLEKWSKKRPRLKSGVTKSKRCEEPDGDKTFNYDSLNEADLSVLLGNEDFKARNDDDDDNDSLSNLRYEVHSDIEQLLLTTERSCNEEAPIDWKPRKSRKHKARDEHHSRKSKRKSRKIKISKPSSPQTEQVIRVDVTSNMSCENCVHKIKAKSPVDGYVAGGVAAEIKTTHRSPITADLIDDGHHHFSDDAAAASAAAKKELKRNLNREEDSRSSENCQEHAISNDDFIIVRCRQLALSQRRR